MNAGLPEGLTMRQPTLEDLEIVHALERAYDIAYTGEAKYSLDELQALWSLPAFKMAYARLIFDSAGQLVAYLDLTQRLRAKNYINLAIRPDYSDPRLCEYLLALGEAWARERIAQAPQDARVTLNLQVPANDEYKRRACARAGVEEVRRNWRMEINLREAPDAPDWPAGIELRPFVPHRDERLVFDTDETAFQDHWGYMPQDYAEWLHWTVERADFDPSLWFLAYEGEQIAGISLCRRSIREIGWVGTLAVLRPWRRQGLGLALLRHSFGEFYRRGMRRAGLGVDSQNLTGATRLYKRAGMYIACERIDCEKELRAGVEITTRALPE